MDQLAGPSFSKEAEEGMDAWVDGTDWLDGRKGAVGEMGAEESDDGGSERIADMYATEASNCL